MRVCDDEACFERLPAEAVPFRKKNKKHKQSRGFWCFTCLIVRIVTVIRHQSLTQSWWGSLCLMPSSSNPPKLVHWSPRRGHLARDRPDLEIGKIYENASFQKVSRQKSTCFWWHTFAYYCIWSLIKPECTLWIRTRTLTCWNDLQISKIPCPLFAMTPIRW